MPRHSQRKVAVIGPTDPTVVEHAAPGDLVPLYCTLEPREVVFRRNNEQGDIVRMVIRSAQQGLAVKAEVQGPLDRMLAKGLISQGERDAGKLFQERFAKAGYDSGYVTVNLKGVRGPPSDGLGNQQARDSIHRALKLLAASDRHPLGWPHPASWAWWVLGCGYSVQDWIALRRNRGYSVDRRKASGIAMAALDALHVNWKRWAL